GQSGVPSLARSLLLTLKATRVPQEIGVRVPGSRGRAQSSILGLRHHGSIPITYLRPLDSRISTASPLLVALGAMLGPVSTVYCASFTLCMSQRALVAALADWRNARARVRE